MKYLKGKAADPSRTGPYKINHLKMKIKSLAAEAEMLRREEVKWWGPSAHRYDLHNHRKQVVGPESRHSLLAYGFLRDLPYGVMESHIYTKPDWTKVENIAKRFCDEDWRVVGQRFARWKDEASAFADDRFTETTEHAKNRSAARLPRDLSPQAIQTRKDVWNAKQAFSADADPTA